MSTKLGFDRLAKYYSMLEYIVFGNLLLRSRFALFSELKDLKHALIVGGGNGRLLKKLLEYFPDLKIDCLEQSPKMIEIASSRLSISELKQVSFIELDIFEFSTNNLYDCIFSPFFLDCFAEPGVNKIIAELGLYLKKDGYWYDVDFYLPKSGFALARAKLYLKLLYLFFNFASSLKTKQLVNTELIFIKNNYHLVKSKTFSKQLLRTCIYKK